MFQLNLKVESQKPEKFGSGVKEDNYVFLSDNIHINWIQSTTVTLLAPFKTEKVIKKTGLSIIKDRGNYSSKKFVGRRLLFRR